VSDGALKQTLINRQMLDYRRYTTFLRERQAMIIEHVKKRLEMYDSDFLSLT